MLILIRVFAILVFIFCSMSHSYAYEKEIKAICAAIGDSIAASGKKAIAVVDFSDLQGNVTELGRFLAEEFSVGLSELGKGFEVVDRTNLKTLLKEHELIQLGLIDQKAAKKVGEIAGVQALITGTLTPFGDTIRLAVKVLDTSSAKVIGGARGDIPKTKAIDELLAKGVGSAVSAAQAPLPKAQDAAAKVSRSSSPTPSTLPYSSNEPRLKSAQIGNLLFSVKSLNVANDARVSVFLDIYNNYESEIRIASVLPQLEMECSAV